LKEITNKGILDTNLILRHITQDDTKQSNIATKLFIELLSGEHVFYVTVITFAELVWVLESVYEYTREEVSNILNPLFNTPNLNFENQEILEEALILYKALRVDYADCYNACFARYNNIKSIYTFDKDYNKFKFIDRIEPE
jgi:uncharacterized protein